MSVKARCPKCQAEISDPADPKNVPCPACGITFNSAPPSKVVWTLAALLVACTLVAMWSTAARVKARKLAARQGERIEAPIAPLEKPRLRLSAPSTQSLDDFFAQASKGDTVDIELAPSAPPQRQREVTEAADRRGVATRFVVGEARQLKVQIREGRSLNVEHFVLQYDESDRHLTLLDSRGRKLVVYAGLTKGAQRGWQELQMSFLEVEQEQLTIMIELRPGSPSFGSGYYHWLRPGLRVQLGPGLSATILAWDDSKPELKLKIEAPGAVQEQTVTGDDALRTLGIRYGLGNENRHLFLELSRDE